MSNASSPQVDYAKEVRFAVVMYGGVSLAIYINGVAQELFRMVRATAENVKAANGDRVPLSGVPTAEPQNALQGTERVYRKLSYLLSDDRLLEECRQLASTAEKGPAPRLREKLESLIETDDRPLSTKFVIDILSGTSAGGINGIYLAKALANDQQIDQLKDLWINEGDIALLLNDKRSVLGLNLKNQAQPQSLLNSRRMYFKLLKSLEDMEEQRPSDDKFDSPYVDELDLFITTTDIEGVPVPLRLSDSVVFERRHRNVFHFKYGKEAVVGNNFNDFIHSYNPFLAFAARCTSSFPFAFEPMRLCDIEEVVKLFGGYKSYDLRKVEKLWQRYFNEELDTKTGSPIRPPRFAKRSFGDGGYLDNKPFSYATETLMHRQAEVPVDRKLIYIEPSPDHPEDNPASLEKINALQNVKAAILDLPTYETIREDLQRVLERNQLIERVNRIVSGIERDVNNYIPHAVDLFLREKKERAANALVSDPGAETEEHRAPDLPPNWADMDLAEMVDENSRYFLPYRRLRISAVTDEIAKLVARLANFDEKSDQFLAVRCLVRLWREENYVDYRTDGPVTVNRFLWSYDFNYRLRRLSFVRTRVDQLSQFKPELNRELEKFAESLNKLKTELGPAGILDEVRNKFPQIRLQEYGERILAYAKRPEELQPILRFIKSELNEIYKDLRTSGRLLRARGDANGTAKANPLFNDVNDIGLTPEDLTFILGTTPAGKAVGSAARPLTLEAGQDEDDYIEHARLLLSRSDKSHIRTQLNQIAVKLGELLEVAFLDTRNKSNALFGSKEDYEPISQRGKALLAQDPNLLTTEIAQTVFGFVSYYYNQFDDYDQIRFPIMYETDYGEADVVEIIRISPEDAVTLINERHELQKSSTPGKARLKLAGVSLHHFGAFLDRTWRQNDIMWGRLDGTERIISGLLPGKLNEPIRQELIKEAHLAILKEELKPESVAGFQSVISEALLRASGGLSINDAITETLGPLERSAVKTRLEEIMRLVIKDDDLLKFMSKGYEVNRQLDPKPLLTSISRSTQIIGKMFEDLADSNGFEGKRLAWIARLGQIFWGLVEVAVPNGIPNLLIFHWLKILYLFAALLIVGSILLGSPDTQSFGWKALALTFGMHIAVLLLRDYLRLKHRWQHIVLAVLALGTLVLASVGGYKLFSLGLNGILNEIVMFAQGIWSYIRSI